MAYPCPCSIQSSSQPSCPSGTCLKLATIVIDPLTGPVPCGGSFSIDIGAESDLTACTTTIVWTLVSYDTGAFEDVALSSSGVLTGTATTGADAGQSYEFLIHVGCEDGYLSQYATVTLTIKNLCFGITCEDGFVCDPCTGDCVAEEDAPDAEIF